MKITNENVFFWFLFFLMITMFFSQNMFGINDFTEFLRRMSILWSAILGLLGLGIFFRLCVDGDIQFEIDILKPFRWLFGSRPTPEEEDKKNK